MTSATGPVTQMVQVRRGASAKYAGSRVSNVESMRTWARDMGRHTRQGWAVSDYAAFSGTRFGKMSLASRVTNTSQCLLKVLEPATRLERVTC